MSTHQFSKIAPTDPSSHVISEVKFNKKQITHAFLNPNASFFAGTYEAKARTPYYVNPPYGSDNEPMTWEEYEAETASVVSRGESLTSKFDCTLDIRVDNEVETYDEYFNAINSTIVTTCKDKNWFDKKMSEDNIRFILKDAFGTHKTHGYRYFRVKVSAAHPPTVRVVTGKDENGYIFETGTVKDLRSAEDGGKGYLRNAEVIALVEIPGLWLKMDPNIGVKLRLAQIVVFPSEESAPANSSISNNRSIDAFASMIPGGFRME